MNLISYVQEPHNKLRDSKTVRQLEFICHSKLRRKGASGTLKEDDSQEDEKSEYSAEKCLPCQAETTEHRGISANRPAALSPAYHVA